MYTFCSAIHCRQHKCWFLLLIEDPTYIPKHLFFKNCIACYGFIESLHYFSFVLSITVLHVSEETEIPKSGLEIVQIVWEGRPVYLCALSALVSILEQLERLRCTSLSLSVRQRAGYTQKSASAVGQIWRTNIGQIWNGNLQNCWEKEERMRRGALSLPNKEQPYLIFVNFWTPPHYIGLWKVHQKVHKFATK